VAGEQHQWKIAMQACAKNLVSLRKFSLRKCTVTAGAFAIFLQAQYQRHDPRNTSSVYPRGGCRGGLKLLDVFACSKLNAATLLTIAQTCPLLEDLNAAAGMGGHNHSELEWTAPLDALQALIGTNEASRLTHLQKFCAIISTVDKSAVKQCCKKVNLKTCLLFVGEQGHKLGSLGKETHGITDLPQYPLVVMPQQPAQAGHQQPQYEQQQHHLVDVERDWGGGSNSE
jgi:hypothetical protein